MSKYHQQKNSYLAHNLLLKRKASALPLMPYLVSRYSYIGLTNISKNVWNLKLSAVLVVVKIDEAPRINLEQLFKTPFDLVLSNTKKEILNKYVELWIAEESFLKQKSRVKWLALGDQNSKYFHQEMCSHRARNTILSLTDSSGCLIDDPEAVKQEILGYYVGLLGTAFDGKVDALPTLNLAIQSKVPIHFRFQLIALVT
ncbi:hypothetical protein RHGRI_030665 [Rhododendron griersonianum]|uniref:Uncharacterized protein n=1 Tax=Rhododendron griersonianum TaxID=479676 RepID=A0AAV6IAV2_9ERIC|nr:hypothetical protein RHGRI_030665 [Rhododendron griersonianum]